MSAVVYVEGGGDSKDLRSDCRKSFAQFFANAGLESKSLRVFACGSREQAYRNFRHALRDRGDMRFAVLLVDSESPVAKGMLPWAHLRRNDNWETPDGATSDSAHLMVQCMESWFLADSQSLATYFGQGFNANALPGNPHTEAVPKVDVLAGLKSATRQCRPKGEYAKGRHSFAILSEIAPEKVLTASPHAKHLIDVLRAKA